jgi:hypothetical protein
MAYTITPLAGIDLNNLAQTNPNSAGTAVPTIGPLGAEVFGSDGLRYVFAKAGGAIPASTAICSIDATTFAATATGGAYLSPAYAMVSGDYAWFGKASV